ncbi:MAG: VCBS repeat-containing protein, partial [Calditrichales bacterium]
MFRILCQTILILLVIIASAYSFDPLFDSQVDYQMGVLISSALRADFTNDGFIDIICASNSLYNGSAYNHFNYYINNGDGTFREPLEIPAGLNNSVMLQGDFNSDGWKDFVTVSNTPYIPKFYINIYMNQGNGTLIYKQAYSNFSTPYIAVMDINDDGLDDILQMDNSNINVLFCKGDGTFTFGTNGEEMVKIPMDRFGQMRPWDVNKDDYPDLLIQGSRTVTPPAGQPYSQSFIATYINNADTTFQFAAEFLYGSSADVSITGTNPGYYNSDSNEDLLIRDNQNLWTVLTGNGDGSFSLHASFGLTTDLPVADGDINGDGLTDLIISDSENATMSVMLNTGDADINFADPVVYSGKWDDKPNYPTLSSVDLNNDAYDDIILSKYALSTIINYGDGTFPILKTIENMGIEAIDMITEDFNRDGWPDIMTIDANRLYLSYNDGTGDFLPREIISSGLEWQNGIFSGDFNADEIPDFAVTKGLKLFYGREEGGFQAGPSYGDSLLGLSAIGGASAYLNDDAFIDYALYYFGSLRIVLSDSSGAYQFESYVFSTDGVSQIKDIGIADIDNDKDMDILFGFNQAVYINYNDGDGDFHTRDSLTTAGGASWLVLDDFNDDGTTDIAATHAESFNSYVFVHLNKG